MLRVSFKSHCAAGKTYDMVVVSNIDDHPAVIEMKYKERLNLPNPVAEMAFSKSASSSSATKGICHHCLPFQGYECRVEQSEGLFGMYSVYFEKF